MITPTPAGPIVETTSGAMTDQANGADVQNPQIETTGNGGSPSPSPPANDTTNKVESEPSASPPSQSTDAPSAQGDEQAQSILIAQIYLNGVPLRDAMVATQGNDILMRQSDATGIPFPPKQPTVSIKGIKFLSLASSGLQYKFDPSDISLSISYTSKTYAAVHFEQAKIPQYTGQRSPYLSYYGQAQRGLITYGGQVGFSGPRDLFSLGFSNDGYDGIARSILQYKYRTADGMGSWTFGDQFGTSSLGAASQPLFGIGFDRGSDDRQSESRQSDETVGGKCDHPCTLSVTPADGRPEQDADILPGAFTVSGVPKDSSLSLTDRVTGQPVPYWTEAPKDETLLRNGFTQYGLAVGAQRTCVFNCMQYGGLAVQGHALHGFTSWFSAGGDVQVDQGVGIGLDAILSDQVRNLRLALGVGPRSSDLIIYSERHGKFWWNTAYGVSGMPFYDQNLDYTVTSGRTRNQNVSIGYASSSISYLENFQPGSPAYRQLMLTQRISLWKTEIFAALMRGGLGGSHALSLHVSVPLQLLKNRPPTMVTASIGGSSSAQEQVYQNINAPSGLNYSISPLDNNYRISYNGDMTQASLSGNGILTMQGGIGFLHGVHFISNPQDGYVVVIGEHGDKVIGDSRTHEIGKHGVYAFPEGDLSAPEKLSLIPRSSLTSTADLNKTEVFPAPYSGQIVEIKHSVVHAVIGSLGVPTAFGELDVTVDGKVESSPLGSSGEFYFSNLPPGTWKAHALIPGGACSVTLHVPKTYLPQIDLGELICK